MTRGWPCAVGCMLFERKACMLRWRNQPWREAVLMSRAGAIGGVMDIFSGVISQSRSWIQPFFSFQNTFFLSNCVVGLSCLAPACCRPHAGSYHKTSLSEFLSNSVIIRHIIFFIFILFFWFQATRTWMGTSGSCLQGRYIPPLSPFYPPPPISGKVPIADCNRLHGRLLIGWLFITCAPRYFHLHIRASCYQRYVVPGSWENYYSLLFCYFLAFFTRFFLQLAIETCFLMYLIEIALKWGDIAFF